MKRCPLDPGVQASRPICSRRFTAHLRPLCSPLHSRHRLRSQPCGNDTTPPPLHQWPPRLTALSTPTCNERGDGIGNQDGRLDLMIQPFRRKNILLASSAPAFALVLRVAHTKSIDAIPTYSHGHSSPVRAQSTPGEHGPEGGACLPSSRSLRRRIQCRRAHTQGVRLHTAVRHSRYPTITIMGNPGDSLTPIRSAVMTFTQIGGYSNDSTCKTPLCPSGTYPHRCCCGSHFP